MNVGRLRIATAGTGFFSQFHYNAWRRMADEGVVELVAVFNRTLDKAESFADQHGFASSYDDFETMLDEAQVDLVDIITPPETHVQFVRAAVDRQVSVICQKPFTPTLIEAEQLCKHIERKNAKVVVHEDFRFQPWYAKIKSLLEQGAIGDCFQVTFALRPGDGQGPEAYLNRQPYFQKMPRFLVHETAVHFVDTFRYLLGDVTSVYAQLNRLNPGIEGEDAAIILFNFKNGCRGVFDGNRLADHNAENCRLTMGEMTLEGSRGTIKLDGNGRIWLRAFNTQQSDEVHYEWNNTDFGGDCVYSTNRHVVDHLRSGDRVVNTAAEYLTNLRIEDAIYRSAESGELIKLAAKN